MCYGDYQGKTKFGMKKWFFLNGIGHYYVQFYRAGYLLLEILFHSIGVFFRSKKIGSWLYVHIIKVCVRHWSLKAFNWKIYRKATLFPTSKPLKIYFLCQIKWLNIFHFRSFSYRQINLTWKANLLHFTWKIKNVKIPKKCNYNIEILFKTRKCCPPPPHNFVLFELDLDINFLCYVFYYF